MRNNKGQFVKGLIPWNKGLTIITDKRIANYGKKESLTKIGKRYKTFIFICKFCKKEKIFNLFEKNRIYCSPICHYKDIKGKSNGRFHTQQAKEKMSKNRKGKLQYHLRGENSPNWKGGIIKTNSHIRASTEYKEWRIEILKRDNFTCQICDYKSHTTIKGKSDIQANHIKRFADYPELRFISTNGITLCKKCHLMIAEHEEEWESYFNFNLMTRGFLPDTNWEVINGF